MRLAIVLSIVLASTLPIAGCATNTQRVTERAYVRCLVLRGDVEMTVADDIGTVSCKR